MIEKLYHKYRQEIFPKIDHIRGATRLKDFLESLALRKVEKVEEKNVKDVFDEEWDNLIIIDACRQDFWKEETGRRGSRISKASSTVEYIRKNFTEGDFSDYVYVTANPQFSDWKFEELTGKNSENTFHSVFKTFNTDWDEDANTVLPEDTVRDAKTAKKLFPDKKIIVHFLPPHYPFIMKPLTKGGIGPDLPGKNNSAWDLAEQGKLSKETVEDAYRDNISYVENYVEKLADELKGKTILTSDHGNFVGESGFYGHPTERDEVPVRKVPYHKL